MNHIFLIFLFLIMLFCPVDIIAYSHFSPYSYCGGNPIKFIDPTGEDIVILNYTEGSHLAMLIQNDDGKWQYYSINGNNVYVSGKHSGDREFNDVAVGSWDSPYDFFHSQYNSCTEDSKNDRSKNHYGFSEGYLIPTSKEQDTQMRDSFTKKAKTRYSPLGNNCVTIVQDVLFDAGIPVAEPTYEKIHIPANIFLGEPEQDIVRPNINPLPCPAFNSIMKVNPNGKYLHK